MPPTSPALRRTFLSIPLMALSIGLAGTGCAAPDDRAGKPIEVARTFVAVYDNWAQDGYSTAVPPDLQQLVSGEALELIESDGRWYSQGGVRQNGSMDIVEARLIDETDTRAVVSLILDSSDVEVLADDQPTWRSEQTRQRLEITLKKDDGWRISELVPAVDEQETDWRPGRSGLSNGSS